MPGLLLFSYVPLTQETVLNSMNYQGVGVWDCRGEVGGKSIIVFSKLALQLREMCYTSG